MKKNVRLKPETYKGVRIDFIGNYNGQGFVLARIEGGGFFYRKNKELAFEYAKEVIDRELKTPSKKVKASFYKYGEYKGMEEVELSDLKNMVLLMDELYGFDVRPEDEDKYFYADKDDIDDDDSGTSVKYAYAIDKKFANF